MGRFGTGFPAGRKRRVPGDGDAIAAIQPSGAWTGVSGSGFSSTPSDPARTTAKPGLQLLVPPNQRFTDSITIGVLAMANDGGSLFDTLGLNMVRVHYEGTVHEITSPTVYKFTDVNGVARSYWAWWITLEHNGTDGEAQIYFEAEPNDPTMQNRVIGPFSFFPAAQLHDLDLEVAPSLPVITNQRYQSIRDALDAMRSNGAQHGRITVTETAEYNLFPIVSTYVPQGYCVIEATVPITINKPSYLPGGSSGQTNGLLRSRLDGMWFRGNNITFDFANVHYIYHENPANRQNVFEGVNFIDSNGRGALWLKGQKPTNYICRDTPYYLECSVDAVMNAFLNASLVRGCTYTDGAYDAFSYARCIAFNTVTDTYSEDWRTPIDAISLQYTGAGATATIEMSGANDTNNRVLTVMVNGASVGTFTAKKNDADFNAGTNYNVANVVAWINGLPDWTATLLDDTRRATSLSHASAALLGGLFAAVDAKTSPVTLHTVFDVHSDAWANSALSQENSIFFGNLLYGNSLPVITFGVAGGMRDIFFVNNAAHTDEVINPAYETMISQWTAPGSHIVISHNSLANQKLFLRPSFTMTADAHCLVANNAMMGIDWEGTPDGTLQIADNHIHAGQTDPAGATGTSIGGDQTNLFADPPAGNFAPAGELVSNKKPPRVKRDRTNRGRSSSIATVGSEA